MIILAQRYCSNGHLGSACAYPEEEYTKEYVEKTLVSLGSFDVTRDAFVDGSFCDICHSRKHHIEYTETVYDTIEEATPWLTKYAYDQMAEIRDPVLREAARQLWESQPFNRPRNNKENKDEHTR